MYVWSHMVNNEQSNRSKFKNNNRKNGAHYISLPLKGMFETKTSKNKTPLPIHPTDISSDTITYP